MTGVPAFYRSN